MGIQWLQRHSWAFDPAVWRMERAYGRTTPGWHPHMFVFACFAMIMILHAAAKVPLGLPILLLDCLTTYMAHGLLRRTYQQLYRMGRRGPTRARWWVELSAGACTLSMAGFVMSMTQVNGLIPLPAGVNALFEWVFLASRWTMIFFFVTGGVGISRGLLQGRPVRGRAIELVAPTFWFLVLMITLNLAPDAMIVPLIIGMAAIVVRYCVAFYFSQQADDPGNVQSSFAKNVQSSLGKDGYRGR